MGASRCKVFIQSFDSDLNGTLMVKKDNSLVRRKPKTEVEMALSKEGGGPIIQEVYSLSDDSEEGLRSRLEISSSKTRSVKVGMIPGVIVPGCGYWVKPRLNTIVPPW